MIRNGGAANNRHTYDPASPNRAETPLGPRGRTPALSSQGIQFVTQSVSTVVLARLLAPADFGLVAMVTAVTGLAVAFADLGLSEATIQRPEITRDQISSLFGINVTVGVLLGLATIAAAPVLAWFYKEPRRINIALALSPTFLFSAPEGPA